MGLFDEVWANCHYCGGDITWQSKALPDPSLRIFPLEAVPIAVAADLDGQWAECRRCGKTYQIRSYCGLPGTIAMSLAT